MSDLLTHCGARFSDCGLYRYTLWRSWDQEAGVLNVIMLNPSTADAEHNDPTVERMERRARMWGFGRLLVTNLYAFRATDPRALYAAEDPIGPLNNQLVRACARASNVVIYGWGTHGERVSPGRTGHVDAIVRAEYATPRAFGFNADGSPKHPLYVGYAVEPVEIAREVAV